MNAHTRVDEAHLRLPSIVVPVEDQGLVIGLAYANPRLPSLLAPVEGQQLMIGLAYARRGSAERQALVWNAALSVDGLAVTVGPRDDNGDWPLIWTAAKTILIRVDKTPPPRLPSILAPVEGQQLMIGYAYHQRAAAERQALAWNAVLSVDGLTVTGGPCDDNGDWPLIWTAAEQ